MRSIAAIALSAVFLCACPKPQGAAVIAPPLSVDLAGSRWWLRVADGQKDERLVEISLVNGVYVCKLANPGKYLWNFRFKVGDVYCQIMRKGPTRYEGSILKKLPDGTAVGQPAWFEVVSPLFMRWSETPEQWERLP